MRKYRLDLATHGKGKVPCLVPDEHDDAAVYIASEVDAVLAELRAKIRSLSDLRNREPPHCATCDCKCAPEATE